MRKAIITASLLLLFRLWCWRSRSAVCNRPKTDSTRLLTGKVLDTPTIHYERSGLPDHMRTRAVKTHIVSQGWQLPVSQSLQPNIYYEV